jgi:PhnB protein
VLLPGQGAAAAVGYLSVTWLAAASCLPRGWEENMPDTAKGIPDTSSVVIPRLVCRNPAEAIDFCTKTFRAVELNRRPGPDGTVAHALMTIGPAMIMIEGEWPTLTSRAPNPDGSSPVVIFVYVEDVDRKENA